MDIIFWYTLLFIFLSALVGTFLNSRARDRCLLDLKGFHVTLEEIDGDLAWGRLNVYSTGIELEYLSAHHDNDGHVESSYIIYKDQYATIQGIYRYHDELSEASQKIRQKSIQKSYHPNIFKRLFRSMRNILNTFKDSIFQSVGVIIGQAQKANPKSTLLKTQDKQITAISKEIIQVSANAYEPILEKYIGKKVVLDVRKGDKEIEYYGILKEYTNNFIEILDIEQTEDKTVEVADEHKLTQNDHGIIITRDGLKFSIENKGNKILFIKQIVAENFQKKLNIICNPESVADFYTESQIKAKITIHFKVVRKMDVIIPRKYCLVRHSGEMN